MFNAKVTGLPEVQQALRDLHFTLRRRAVRNALTAAARVLRDDAKSRAPVLRGPFMKAPYRKPGTVRNAIGVVRQPAASLPAGAIGVSVKVRPAKEGQRGAKSRNDPFYWVFLEFGTKFMAPRPFLAPAIRRMGAAVQVFEERLAVEVARFMSSK